MLLALLSCLALSQHAPDDVVVDEALEAGVEQRLEDLEALVEQRDLEVDDLRSATSRLLELVGEQRGVDPLELLEEPDAIDDGQHDRDTGDQLPSIDELELEVVQLEED